MAIKYFSMFSGIGGFELGMEKSKHEFECIGFSEVDKYAISIYTRQFPKHRNFGDATKINPNDLPDFELLVGGFPCQAFSIAGQRRGFNDTRGTLFFEIARILASKQPTYFLLENVRGLLSHNKGETFQTILKVCDDLGYDVSWQVYNSKDYGVPQSRQRLYLKGYSRRQCGSEILSLPRTSTETNEINTVLDDDDAATFKKLGDGRSVTTTTGDCFALTCSRPFRPLEKRLTNYVKESKEWLDKEHNFLDLGDKAATTTIDGNFFAITTRHRGMGLHKKQDNYVLERENHNPLKIATATKRGYDVAYPNDGVRLDPPNGSTGRGRVQKDLTGTLTCGGNWGTVDQDYLIRRLTPRECERLQGFPDDWTKFGKDGELISDTQRYKCCGNAVTVNVIQHIFDNWDLKV